MTWRFIVAPGAAVFAGGLIVYTLVVFSPVQSPLPDKRPSTAVRYHQEPMTAPAGERKAVAALGRLEPHGETIAISGSGNDRLGRLLVQEGREVEEGAILAYLESYTERLAEKQYAESQLHDAEARLHAETTYGQASIAEAELRLKQLEDLQPLDLQAQEAKVRQLEADLTNAARDMRRVEGLQQKGTIAQQEVDHQILRTQRAQEDLLSAKVVLARLKTAYSNDLLMARAQLKTARASLVRVQTAIQLASLQRNLELAQARVERTVLRAPVQGTILRILRHPGESIDTRPILQMGNTRQIFVVAEVYETDISLIRAGQSASVSSPALPEALRGTVEHIGQMIAKNDILDIDPTANKDARVVEVKIRLNQSALASRLINLQVYVLIDLTEDTTERLVGTSQR